MRLGIGARIFLGVGALVGCSTAPASPAPTPTWQGPSTPVESSFATQVTVATTGSSCLNVTVPPGAVTRYSTPPGSLWWVTVAVIESGCADTVIIDKVTTASTDPTEVLVLGSRLRAADDGPISAVTSAEPQQTRTSGDAVTSLAPSQRVVVELLTQIGGSLQPQSVPEVTMRWTEPTGTLAATIASATRLCSCPLPQR